MDVLRSLSLADSIQEYSASQHTVIAMRTDEGDYTVATSLTPPQPCLVYEEMQFVRTIKDPLKKAILQQGSTVVISLELLTTMTQL